MCFRVRAIVWSDRTKFKMNFFLSGYLNFLDWTLEFSKKSTFFDSLIIVIKHLLSVRITELLLHTAVCSEVHLY